jgi:hypothetical protein
VSETEPPAPGPPDDGQEPGLDLPWQDTAELTRRSPRSHRAQNQIVGRLLPPVTAVAVVVIVILLLIFINAHPPSDSSAAGLAGGNSAPSPKVVVPTKVVPSTPPVTTTAPPVTTTASSPPPVTPATTPAHTSTPAKTHHKPAASTAMATVQVLNNSRRTGLAHVVASQLAERGWHIGIVGNLQGAIPVPTVYYAPGQKAAAQHLEREFSSIKRVEPNSAAHLTSAGITLVLTADWGS